ncbi:MAG: VWA domain-containing protein [Deltaproteobacteria bacterium]|nr:VWA domain-containing protein [Deltaproteobacteria bacterium]
MRRTTLAMMLSAISGCTDASLQVVVPLGNDLKLAGEFCTPPPQRLAVSTRIAFVIDNSNSMRELSDPNGRRFDAVQQIIDSFAAVNNVEFAVICWANKARLETSAGFTKEPVLLAAALNNCRDDLLYTDDGTNYVAALDKARDLIAADDNHEERVDYLIEFVTDGMPTADDLAPEGLPARIFGAVTQILDAGVRKTTGSTRVDVLLFAAFIQVPQIFLDLLPRMAELGEGAFLQVYDDTEILESMKDLARTDTWLQSFEFRELFIESRSVRLAVVDGVDAAVQAYIDSDGDGLVDVHEDELGTDRHNRDTDGDGASDLAERRLAGRDPLTVEADEAGHGADDALDEDQDGLNGYEERLLGLWVDKADSDEDGVPDGLEVLYGTDPLRQDDRADYDDDNLANIDEIKQHTNPLVDEGDDVRRDFAYRYSGVTLVEQTAGRSCYSFAVENVRLADIPAADRSESRGGRNEIEVLYTDKPTNAKRLTTHQACGATTSMTYREGMRDPNRVELVLDRSRFCD